MKRRRGSGASNRSRSASSRAKNAGAGRGARGRTAGPRGNVPHDPSAGRSRSTQPRLARRSQDSIQARSNRQRVSNFGGRITRPANQRRTVASTGIPALLDAQPWDSLFRIVEASGVDPDPAMKRLRHYAELLIDWNRRVSNLISRNDETRLVERHLRESLEPLRLLRESRAQRWLDFGSGAGLPA